MESIYSRHPRYFGARDTSMKAAHDTLDGPQLPLSAHDYNVGQNMYIQALVVIAPSDEVGPVDHRLWCDYGDCSKPSLRPEDSDLNPRSGNTFPLPTIVGHNIRKGAHGEKV